MAQVDISTGDAQRLSAEFAYNIEKNPQIAIEQYREIIKIENPLPDDFNNLGDLLLHIGDGE